jgi:hypothetical protein
MKSFIYTFIAILILLSVTTGCRSEKRSSDSQWKPWPETDDNGQLTPDSTLADSILSTDTLSENDSTAISDTLSADSLLHASPRGSHQVLQGRAGNKEIYLNFSTINGSHLIGNAMIDGRPTEITGTTDMVGSHEHIVIVEPRAMRDSTRFRIEASSTETGYQGTYTEGALTHPITLKP